MYHCFWEWGGASLRLVAVGQVVLAAIPHNFSFAQLEPTQPYLCIARYGRSLHARIEEQNHKFSFDCHDPGVFMSANIPSLMEHYKDPASCMFFEPMLCQAVNRKSPFSLQFLARATICDTLKSYSTVDQLELPKSLKAYLKEYHYRHKVRVRRLDLEGATWTYSVFSKGMSNWFYSISSPSTFSA